MPHIGAPKGSDALPELATAADSISMTLAATPVSIGVARTQARQLCQRQGLGDVCDTATLLVSELVTNAVLYGAGEITLQMSATDHELLVKVTDPGSEPPRINHHPAPDQAGGRGLFLIDTLANNWNYQLHPGGKTVWFCLERSAPDRATESAREALDGAGGLAG